MKLIVLVALRLLVYLFLFFPLTSFADWGENFLVVDCNKDQSFKVIPIIIWNEKLEALSSEIAEHDGEVKQDGKQLIHLLTVGDDVESKCRIENHQLEARFYNCFTGEPSLDLVDNGNIEATYKAQNQGRFVDENRFGLRYTPQIGWEFFCGMDEKTTRWRKAGKGANEAELKDECSIERDDFKYPSSQDWRQLRLMRPICSVAISRSQLDLVKAIKNGKNNEAVKLLEVISTVNYIGAEQEQQPLHWAVVKKNLPLVKALLEHGADPNAVNCRGETAIVTALALRDGSTAIGTDEGLDVLRMLLHKGANPNAMSVHRNWSALSRAASYGDIEAMTVLLDAGADPNLAGDTSGGSLPIFSALSVLNKNQLQTVQLLLERGANPNARRFDYTILSEAIGCIYPNAGHEDQRLLLVKLLLQYGADPNLPANGVMPFACASSLGFEKIKLELHLFGVK